MTRKKKLEILPEIFFDLPERPFDSDEMAKETVQMLTDPTNNIVAVMPDKDGKPVFITRE